jgi:hypothetical protein
MGMCSSLLTRLSVARPTHSIRCVIKCAVFSACSDARAVAGKKKASAAATPLLLSPSRVAAASSGDNSSFDDDDDKADVPDDVVGGGEYACRYMRKRT